MSTFLVQVQRTRQKPVNSFIHIILQTFFTVMLACTMHMFGSIVDLRKIHTYHLEKPGGLGINRHASFSLLSVYRFLGLV